MLDQLFLKKLSKKGKIYYFVGQLLLDAVFIYVLFGVLDYSLGNPGSSTRSDTELILISGILVNAVLMGVICVILWNKEDEKTSEEVK